MSILIVIITNEIIIHKPVWTGPMSDLIGPILF